jgi:putative membrane protein
MKTSTRSRWIVAGIIIGLALLAGGFWLGRASPGTFGYGYGLRNPNLGFRMLSGFGFGGIVPMILTILFWVAVIALGMWLISGLVSRANSRPPASLPPAGAVLDILNKRYARGEITKEQFDEIRRDLNV